MALNKQAKRELILNGKLLKIILVLSIPVVLNNFVLSLYNIVDSLFSKNIGDGGLAAVSFVSPVMGFINAASSAIAVTVTALVARNIGKNNHQNAKKIAANALLISISVAVVMAVIGFILSYQIVVMLQASAEYSHLASLYFRYALISLPFKFIADIYFGYKGARGETMAVMVISFIVMIVKIITSFILVNGFSLGVLGLGLATLLSQLTIFGFAIYDLLIRKNQFSLSFNDFKFDKKVLIPFSIMLLPLLIEKTSMSFSHIVVNMFITQFDQSVIAAYGLTNQINTLVFTVSSALGSALITIVAQNLAVGNYTKSKQAIFASIGLGLAISSVLLAGLYFFQEPIIRIFTDDIDTIYHTKNAMNAFSHTALAWTFMQVSIGVFYASGYSFIPIIISASRLFVFRIPVLYFMLNFTNLAEFSIWYCMLFANIAAAILSILLLVFVKWHRTPKYLQEKKGD